MASTFNAVKCITGIRSHRCPCHLFCLVADLPFLCNSHKYHWSCPGELGLPRSKTCTAPLMEVNNDERERERERERWS